MTAQMMVCLFSMLGGVGPLAQESSEMEQVEIIPLSNLIHDEALWFTVNDGVMGGLSESGVSITPEDHLLFSGDVSLENSGGFASCRLTFGPIDGRGHEGFLIRLRGDGHRYGFSARDHDGVDGINHRVWFETPKDEWIEVSIPFSELRPERRGRELSPANRLNLQALYSVGFIIADKQEGPFSLLVESISLY